MVSFHLRFDGNASFLGWSHFKEWRYRSVLAKAVTNACGADDLYDTFRPIDIVFGTMTNRYVTVQVKVHEEDDVITVKNAVSKLDGKNICDYFNEHKDIKVDSVDSQKLEEDKGTHPNLSQSYLTRNMTFFQTENFERFILILKSTH